MLQTHNTLNVALQQFGDEAKNLKIDVRVTKVKYSKDRRHITRFVRCYINNVDITIFIEADFHIDESKSVYNFGDLLVRDIDPIKWMKTLQRTLAIDADEWGYEGTFDRDNIGTLYDKSYALEKLVKAPDKEEGNVFLRFISNN